MPRPTVIRMTDRPVQTIITDIGLAEQRARLTQIESDIIMLIHTANPPLSEEQISLLRTARAAVGEVRV